MSLGNIYANQMTKNLILKNIDSNLFIFFDNTCRWKKDLEKKPQLFYLFYFLSRQYWSIIVTFACPLRALVRCMLNKLLVVATMPSDWRNAMVLFIDVCSGFVGIVCLLLEGKERTFRIKFMYLTSLLFSLITLPTPSENTFKL